MKRIIGLIIAVICFLVASSGCNTNHEEEAGISNDTITPNDQPASDNANIIPIPKEGYEYLVRNSISEKELSLFNSNPSLQKVISYFGYSCMARIEIDRDKEEIYYLYYLVNGNKLDIIFHKDFSLKKVFYRDKLLSINTGESDEINGENPIGIVRDDINRSELGFIDTKTTPEELQNIIGAPHRDCLNDQIINIIGDVYIKFFMSSYFPYRLDDNSVLLVHYTKGKDLAEMNVASAVIYDEEGNKTVLVDRFPSG